MIKDRLDPRVSHQHFDQLYFWTATIHSWIHLLEADFFKDIIINCLKNLSDRKLVEIFGFVIMPNHVHFIWNSLQYNGKESPQGSFLKFTAHEFKKRLVDTQGTSALAPFKVEAMNKRYQFWQRDPMAIKLFNLPVAEQKLMYTHRNPTVDRWQLAAVPEDYKYSSARFYTTGNDEFGFLQNVYDAFQFGF